MKIVFTGGGTSGHVIPNLVIIEKLQQEVNPLSVFYVGQKNSLEEKLIKERNITFYSIIAGKLRRYFDWQNFIDPFKILIGIVQAYFVLNKIKPQVVFSKGGFVAVPVVIAAWLRKIPVITHESDITLGLANKIILNFARTVLTAYPQTSEELRKRYSSKQVITVGLPIRDSLLQGKKEAGLKFTGFNKQKTVIFILGGSQWSQKINEFILRHIESLTAKYQIIWQTGKNNFQEIERKLLDNKQVWENIKLLDYIGEEMADLMAITEMVITRCGATTLFELLALRKKAVLVPLIIGCRGDQLLNAQFMAETGLGKVFLEDNWSDDLLLSMIEDMIARKIGKITSLDYNKLETIVKVIEKYKQ